MNDAFNEIVSIPKDVTNNPVTVDLCIVSHMFGQDLKMDILENYKVKNPNCIMIEDRVQGGYFNKNFSNGFIDMAIFIQQVWIKNNLRIRRRFCFYIKMTLKEIFH